jgi:glycyl-tRNA synthetase alpha chain
MEVTQFTYFQQMGGIACDPVCTEITYGLERIATIIQGIDNHMDIDWNGAKGDRKLTYRDVFMENERQFSEYNFNEANVENLLEAFNKNMGECHHLLEKKLVLPAYEQCIKASHAFNLLQARGVISVTERAGYIGKVRSLAKACCEAWIESTTAKSI